MMRIRANKATNLEKYPACAILSKERYIFFPSFFLWIFYIKKIKSGGGFHTSQVIKRGGLGEGGQKLAVFSHSFLLHTLKWRQPLAGAWQVLRHLPRFSPLRGCCASAEY